MKFLIIGLGSMGKRRIRNLLFNKIEPESIIGFDPAGVKRAEVEKNYNIKTYDDFLTAEKIEEPEAYIISTPPNFHYLYFLQAARKKKHFFVEATTVDKGYEELETLIDGSFVAAPSCTFRYFPAVKMVKQVVAAERIGKIISFTYYLGQYLPDWHPWEDYRQAYFAQKETGGAREMFVFELIWLTDLINSKIKEIKGFVKKLSDLEMPADDVYAANLLFENKVVGNLMVDVISRSPFRTLRLIGSAGVLEWEWLSYQIRIYSVIEKKWETIEIEKGKNEKGYIATEDMYQEEIKTFLDAINGIKAYPYSFKEDHSILKAMFELEKNNYED